MPDLYIITGSNGAGKSSLGPAYLPQLIRDTHTVFDGDLLYTRKLSELFPAQIPSPKYARQAALEHVTELFTEQTQQALAAQADYVYEGHFTNENTWDIPRQFKQAGYQVHLIFFGLRNPDLSALRVAGRVLEGGHHVDRITLEDNFYGNLAKLNQHFDLIDDLTIVDTSEIEHEILYKTVNGNLEYYCDRNDLPDWFTSRLPAILANIPQ